MMTDRDLRNQFDRHTAVWEDCSIGYAFLATPQGTDPVANLGDLLARPIELEVFPWLDESRVSVQCPPGGFFFVEKAEFTASFAWLVRSLAMEQSEEEIPESALGILVDAFISEFHEPAFFTNFGSDHDGQFPPGFRRVNDGLSLCMGAIDMQRVGIWIFELPD